jgi:geranylgeranyl pyrophosphate synthase
MTNSGERHLPSSNEVSELTGIRGDHPLFQDSLFQPLATVLHRPGKKIRHKLVEAGALYQQRKSGRKKLSKTESTGVEKMGRLIEQMHGASLIVDDIQDNSQTRRGGPALHKTHGMPLALNAGNWLYFWQLHQMRQLGLEPEQELSLTQFCLDTYLLAHFGQSIDLGHSASQLPKDQVWPAAMANMRLKTGALISFALSAGAMVAGASRSAVAPLEQYGKELGLYLQMLDDLGNLRNNSLGEKQGEDFRNNRVGFVWAVAAHNLSLTEYEEFKALAQSQPTQAVLSFLEKNGILEKAEKLAQVHKASLWGHSLAPLEIKGELISLENVLEASYG